MITSIETVPKLHGLPVGLPPEGAVEIEVQEGILVFRASKIAQERIENLLEKQKRLNSRKRKKRNSTATKKLKII